MVMVVSLGVAGGWKSSVCLFYVRGSILLFNSRGRVWYIIL